MAKLRVNPDLDYILDMLDKIYVIYAIYNLYLYIYNFYKRFTINGV